MLKYTKSFLGKYMKLTIDEYSQQFKMSKEMVTSKLRAKKLNYIINDGETLIIVDSVKEEPQVKKQVAKKTVSNTKTTVATVLSLYKRENHYLKLKINQLEDKIDGLIDDKEQMLRDERDKIEQIYENKDEQLKHVLELINAKMLHEQDKYETLHLVESSEEVQIIELKTYLKTLELKSSQRKSIKKRFEGVANKDIRIIEQNGKLFLDFSKYDYSDLLAL